MIEPMAPTQKPAPGLGTRAARGAAVTLTAQVGKMAIQVASVVTLARLLTPHDYGLIAMVLVIIGIGEVFRDFGLSSAAIQSTTLTVPQRDNLFWINTGIGAVLAVAVFSGAGILAAVYGQSELVPIAHALSLTFVVNGLATQYRADLIRRLRFTNLATADIIAPAVAIAIAITAALAGWGYWALVAQQLSQAFVMLVIVVVSAGWLPGRPRRHVPLADFLRFGWNMVASQLIGYVSNNVDSLLIGVRFGAGPLGLYSRAFQLLMTPLSQIRSPLTTVALPVLVRLKNDEQRAGDYISRGQLALGYTLVAGLGIVVSASEPITAIFLGPQWLSIAPILRFLALAGVFQTLAFVGYWVYVSRGLTGDLFRYTLLSAAIKVICIAGGSTWGVVGVAAGYALAPALSWPISFWWLSRRAVIPTRRLYAGAFRMLALVGASAAVAGVTSITLEPWGAVVQLAGATVVTAAVYALAALLLRPIRRDIASVINIVLMIRKVRSRPDRRSGQAQ